MSKAPQLPKAPPEYDQKYMNQLIQALDAYFKTLDNPGPLQASSANFSYVEDGQIVRGLAKTTTLSATVSAGTTVLPLSDTSEFSDSGYAIISDGIKTERIQYTGKDSAQLTGVTGVISNHTSGRLVVASGRIGEVVADPLNDFVLKIIP
jgi:hypothetical protein